LNNIIYCKLDLPKLDLPEVWHTDDIELKSQKVDGYVSYWLTEEVDRYVRSLLPASYFGKPNIPGEIPYAWLIAATFQGGVSGYIHKDFRKHALNYVIDPGGDDVITEFYDDDENLIASYKQDPGEWYFLNSGHYKHCVKGITGKRTQVSYSIYEEFTEEQWKFIHEKSKSQQTI